jgi:hypothetical protein
METQEIQQLAEWLTRENRPFGGDDPALWLPMLEHSIRFNQYSSIRAPDGSLAACMTWIRTNQWGSDMVRSFGFFRLAELAIFIPMRGPVMLVTAVTVKPGLEASNYVWKLLRMAIDRNKDAFKATSFLALRSGIVWRERRIRKAA